MNKTMNIIDFHINAQEIIIYFDSPFRSVGSGKTTSCERCLLLHVQLSSHPCFNGFSSNSKNRCDSFEAYEFFLILPSKQYVISANQFDDYSLTLTHFLSFSLFFRKLFIEMTNLLSLNLAYFSCV